MTPAETTAILRQFNAWRRDFDDKIEQPDSREVGEAIDAAVEMIDRLEAAEKAWKINDQTIYDLTEKVIPNTQEKLEAAEKENKVLREALAEKVTSETMLRDLSVGNGSVNASFEGGALHLLVDAFADQFSESGAENYLEMQFHSPATGPLVATLQRVNGKTPHQLREAAEKERNALRAKIEAMERQEPVAWYSKRYGFVYMSRHPSQFEHGSILYLRNGAPAWRIEGSSKVALLDMASLPHGTVFYTLPGAKGEEK